MEAAGGTPYRWDKRCTSTATAPTSTRRSTCAGSRGIARAFEQTTGLPNGVYALSLDAHVQADARLGGKPTTVAYTQHVAFTLEPARLLLSSPASAGAAGTPLVSSSSGSALTTEAARLTLGPINVQVIRARRVATTLAVAALLALAALGPTLVRRARRDPHERALERHSAHLLAVDTAPTIRDDAITVRSLDDLATLADSAETPILVAATPTGNHHSLHAHGNQYVYEHHTPEPAAHASVADAKVDEGGIPRALEQLARLNRRRTRESTR